MRNLLFWKQWPKDQAIPYKILIIVFLLFAVGYAILYYTGNALVFEWEVYNSIKPVQVPVRLIQTGVSDFFIEGTNYINLQEYVGSPINIPTLPAVVLTITFFIGLSLIIAAVTYLSRFWFLVFMGIFIFLMVMAQLGTLELFGSTGRTGFVIVLALFILPAYYFHAIETNIKFSLRLLAMLVASVVLLIIIAFFAGTQKPFLVFAGYGLFAPVLLSILFILLVAHEIVGFFLNIITSNNNELSKNSSIHFVVISIAYLLLILLTFLYNIHILNWQLFYLNAFFLLFISAILGIWGFRHKRTIYEGMFDFQPVGGIIYLALAIVCMGTIGYFFATANDPAIEAFEDIILFTHLGFGIGFFIYVLTNFFTLLHHDQQVYKVVYKPTKMPYFTAQLAGVIASLSFYFLSGQISLHQSKAARFNAIAGFYYSVNDKNLAKEYYIQGVIFGYRNHLSNYNLASLYREEGDDANAVFHFNEAKMKNPTEHAFINLGHVYERHGSFFESLFSLQEGIKRFPNSGVIANNIAIRYSRTDVLDSALYYIDMAKERNLTRKTALANEFGFYLSKGIRFPVDSLLHIYNNHDNLELKTHVLAMMNKENHKILLSNLPSVLKDSLLTINQYAFLQNYITNQKGSVDRSILDRMGNLVENAGSFFAKPLEFAEALAYYDKNEVYRAMEQLQVLQSRTVELESFYARTLASLALDQMAPQLALDFLNYVEEEPESEGQSMRLQAIALLMLGNAAALDIVLDRLDDDYLFAAIKDALWETNFKALHDDTEKYFNVILRGLSMPLYQMAENFDHFNDRENAIQSVKYLVNLNLRHHRIEQAEEFLDFLKPKLPSDDSFYVNAQLKILYYRNELEKLFSLLDQTDKELIFPQEYLLYSAMADARNNRHDLAEQKFNQLAYSNPFFEAGIIEATEYFKRTDDEWFPYNILLQAIRFNRYSVALNQAYSMLALNMGLGDYAREALRQLENLMDPVAFQEFKEEFERVEKSISPAW
jgi:hypothetical protein